MACIIGLVSAEKAPCPHAYPQTVWIMLRRLHNEALSAIRSLNASTMPCKLRTRPAHHAKASARNAFRETNLQYRSNVTREYGLSCETLCTG